MLHKSGSQPAVYYDAGPSVGPAVRGGSGVNYARISCIAIAGIQCHIAR